MREFIIPALWIGALCFLLFYISSLYKENASLNLSLGECASSNKSLEYAIEKQNEAIRLNAINELAYQETIREKDKEISRRFSQMPPPKNSTCESELAYLKELLKRGNP